MIEQLKGITAVQLGAFESFARIHIRSVNDPSIVYSEAQARAIRSALGIPEDYSLLNDIWRTYHHGIPSADHLVNIFVSGTRFDSVSEMRKRYGSIVDPVVAVDVFEQGVRVGEEMHQFQCARNFLDASVSMFCANSKDEPENREVCVAFPGMPNIHPILESALEMVGKYMRYGESIGGIMSRAGDPDKIYSYPIFGSDSMQPVVFSGAGSIYLLGKPPRKDVAANHLKVVRNNDD